MGINRLEQIGPEIRLEQELTPSIAQAIESTDIADPSALLLAEQVLQRRNRIGYVLSLAQAGQPLLTDLANCLRKSEVTMSKLEYVLSQLLDEAADLYTNHRSLFENIYRVVEACGREPKSIKKCLVMIANDKKIGYAIPEPGTCKIPSLDDTAEV